MTIIRWEKLCLDHSNSGGANLKPPSHTSSSSVKSQFGPGLAVVTVVVVGVVVVVVVVVGVFVGVVVGAAVAWVESVPGHLLLLLLFHAGEMNFSALTFFSDKCFHVQTL